VIHLCRIATDDDMPLEMAFGWLSDAERARATGFRFDRDRSRWIRSTGFLRRVLGEVTALPPATLTFHRTPRGKPYLPEGPPHFSLSHSASLAAVAISWSEAVGVDIEEPGRLPRSPGAVEALAVTCFLPEERAAIQAAPDPERAFLRFWTAKEARMKVTGQGMMLEPRMIALDHADGRPTGYLQPPSPTVSLNMFDAGPAIVAVATGDATLHLAR
jgi:4'-phosphopantetheinyl transferase